MQGFPDYFALVGIARPGKSWVRNSSLNDRSVSLPPCPVKPFLSWLHLHSSKLAYYHMSVRLKQLLLHLASSAGLLAELLLARMLFHSLLGRQL